MAELVRTPERWAACSPEAVASGSEAQMRFFVEDAKADIATLLRRLAALEAEVSEGERRGLERAAEVAAEAATDYDNPHNHSLGIASDLMEACSDIAADIRALIPEAPAQRELASGAANQLSGSEVGIPEAPVREGWQPIETAPKDGTVVDLWHEEFGRQADFRWGHTEHCCGEAERYCDSDWHSEEAGWVDTTMNERFFGEDVFTHWRPLPEPPQDNREG